MSIIRTILSSIYFTMAAGAKGSILDVWDRFFPRPTTLPAPLLPVTTAAAVPTTLGRSYTGPLVSILDVWDTIFLPPFKFKDPPPPSPSPPSLERTSSMGMKF